MYSDLRIQVTGCSDKLRMFTQAARCDSYWDYINEVHHSVIFVGNCAQGLFQGKA